MITPRTTLIIGAGASLDYNMPTGERLAKVIVQQCLAIKENSGPATLMAALVQQKIHPHLAVQFGERLDASRLRSVDMLLEKDPEDKKLQLIGRILIANAMLLTFLPGIVPHGVSHETTGRRDWLGYLVNALSAGARTVDDFKRLSIVTFNFDTIIEDVLAPAIAAQLNISIEEAGAAVDEMVLHVHGKIERQLRAGTPTIDEIVAAANSIGIVHDEIPPDRLESIRDRLHGAQVVGFLGFGFHPDNVAKLDIPGRSYRQKNGTVATCAPSPLYLCTCGMGDGERANVKSAFANQWGLEIGKEDQDCLEFLRQYHVLRDNPNERPKRGR